MKKFIKISIIGAIILILYVVAVIIIFNYFQNKRLDRFKKEPNCLTKTTKIEFSRDEDGEDWINFEFKIGNKTYVSNYSLGKGEKIKIKDTIAVRYLCKEPETNTLIIE